MKRNSKNMKVGDTGSPLSASLRTRSDDQPIDLTGASVKFKMVEVNDDDTITTLVDASADIETPETAGLVTYNWATGNTDTAGNHKATFVVTFASGKIETFPPDDYIEINIQDLP